MGANRNVTDNKNILLNYTDITPYPIGGVKADDIAITCTGKGCIPWTSQEGNCIMVETLYCNKVAGTLITPTAVTKQHSDIYQGYNISVNIDSCTGTLQFLHRDGISHHTFTMTMVNNIWFHDYTHTPPCKKTTATTASISRLNDACYSALWHGRLGCPGESITANVHKHVKGIDRKLKRNPFWRCPSSLPNKMHKQPHKDQHLIPKLARKQDQPNVNQMTVTI